MNPGMSNCFACSDLRWFWRSWRRGSSMPFIVGGRPKDFRWFWCRMKSTVAFLLFLPDLQLQARNRRNPDQCCHPWQCRRVSFLPPNIKAVIWESLQFVVEKARFSASCSPKMADSTGLIYEVVRRSRDGARRTSTSECQDLWNISRACQISTPYFLSLSTSLVPTQIDPSKIVWEFRNIIVEEKLQSCSSVSWQLFDSSLFFWCRHSWIHCVWISWLGFRT